MLDLLSFWTGGNRVTGKNGKLLVKFDDGVNDLPLSETCFGSIILPTKHSDYQSFKQNMDIAMKFGSRGFSFIWCTYCSALSRLFYLFIILVLPITIATYLAFVMFYLFCSVHVARKGLSTTRTVKYCGEKLLQCLQVQQCYISLLNSVYTFIISCKKLKIELFMFIAHVVLHYLHNHIKKQFTNIYNMKLSI